jgi:hypothetical protein
VELYSDLSLFLLDRVAVLAERVAAVIDLAGTVALIGRLCGAAALAAPRAGGKGAIASLACSGMKEGGLN